MTLRSLPLLIVALLLAALPLSAQDDFQTFAWREGDLALLVPLSWPEPVAMADGERPALRLAAPDGNATITLSLLDHVALETSLPALLSEALAEQGTPGFATPSAITFAAAAGFELAGASPDGLHAGFARIARLFDGRVLLVTAIAPVAETAFAPLFDQIAGSIVPGADNEPLRDSYSVLWEQGGTDATPLNRIDALASGPNRQLYALHGTGDILILNAETGEIISRPIHELVDGAVDLAVDGMGNIYLANPRCRCVAALSAAGDLLWQIEGFGENEPRQITLANDTVYASDYDGRGAFVRLVGRGVNLPLRPDLYAERFWLAADRSGHLFALTDTGVGLSFDGRNYRALFADVSLPDVRAVEVDSRDHLVVASSSGGVIVLDRAGNLRERLAARVASAPLPGEVLHPTALAALPDGTIIIADSRESGGHLTALSHHAQSFRIGEAELVAGQPVHGAISAGAPRQIWTYSGEAGREVTISAVDITRTGTLDVAIRLLGPDGAEIAYNDDQMGLDLYSAVDAQITRQLLPSTGSYSVVVEHVQGDGLYSLAIVETQSLALDDSGVTRLTGALSDAAPVASYLLEGESGQVFTFTMEALSGSLDPYLKLYGPDGTLIAWNDDAADYDMGITAQIVLFTLPASGTYRLDATRYDGAGQYSLVVVEMR